jgi:hypothetical protein
MGLIQIPLFRHGQSILTAGLIVVMAVFLIEDELVSNIMLLFAAVEVIVTPQILERVVDQ